MYVTSARHTQKQIEKLARMLHVLANEHSIIFKQYANL